MPPTRKAVSTKKAAPTRLAKSDVESSMKVDVTEERRLRIKGKVKDKKIFRADVQLTQTTNEVHAYVSYFMMFDNARGQGLCSTAFEMLLRRLRDEYKVRIVTLFVGSNTPQKACTCYLNGGKNSGFYVVDEAHIRKKCEDGYNFTFVASKALAKEYDRELKTLRKTLIPKFKKLPKLSQMLGNGMEESAG